MQANLSLLSRLCRSICGKALLFRELERILAAVPPIQIRGTAAFILEWLPVKQASPQIGRQAATGFRTFAFPRFSFIFPAFHP